MGVAYHLTTIGDIISAALPRAVGSTVCIFHLLYLLKARMNLDSAEWLVEINRMNFVKDKKFAGTVLKI